MDRHSSSFARERRTLSAMLDIYCRDHHGPAKGVCDGCRDLLAYAEERLEKCRHGEQKPKCSQCANHCYKPAMREKIRAVMRYAGPRMLARHPVLAARHLVRGLMHRPGRRRST